MAARSRGRSMRRSATIRSGPLTVQLTPSSSPAKPVITEPPRAASMIGRWKCRLNGQVRPWRPMTSWATGPTASSSSAELQPDPLVQAQAVQDQPLPAPSPPPRPSPGRRSVTGTGSGRPCLRAVDGRRCASSADESRPPEKPTRQGGRRRAPRRTVLRRPPAASRDPPRGRTPTPAWRPIAKPYATSIGVRASAALTPVDASAAATARTAAVDVFSQVARSLRLVAELPGTGTGGAGAMVIVSPLTRCLVEVLAGQLSQSSQFCDRRGRVGHPRSLRFSTPRGIPRLPRWQCNPYGGRVQCTTFMRRLGARSAGRGRGRARTARRPRSSVENPPAASSRGDLLRREVVHEVGQKAVARLGQARPVAAAGSGRQCRAPGPGSANRRGREP